MPFADVVKDRAAPVKPRRPYRLGAILKFLGNPYYQLMADGMHAKALELGLFIDCQAGLTESDHEGQRAVMEAAIRKGYDAILVSPQTDANLVAVAKIARDRGILLINVDDALLSEADYFIGPDHYQSGVLAAGVIIDKIGQGGKLAILDGFAEDFGSEQRDLGFEATLKKASFEIVARLNCFRHHHEDRTSYACCRRTGRSRSRRRPRAS